MTLDQAVQFFRGTANSLEYELLRAERDNLRLGLELAVIHSSGPISSEQLKDEDHPYARRHGRALRDPSIINTQSGKFVALWREAGLTHSGGKMSGRVENPGYIVRGRRRWNLAQLLNDGTRLMVPRPIVARVRRELLPRRTARIRQAVKDALIP